MPEPTVPTPAPAPSPEDSFVHLHVHTEYPCSTERRGSTNSLAAAAGQGMPAIATTDHGNVFMAPTSSGPRRGKYDIKPIIGIEACITPGTARRDKTRVNGDDSADGGRDDVGGNGAYTHMTLLPAHDRGCTTPSE